MKHSKIDPEAVQGKIFALNMRLTDGHITYPTCDPPLDSGLYMRHPTKPLVVITTNVCVDSPISMEHALEIAKEERSKWLAKHKDT